MNREISVTTPPPVRTQRRHLPGYEDFGLIRIVQVEGQTTGYVVSLDIVRPPQKHDRTS